METRKLWEDLGVDMEKHDQLMTALPTMFKDVFLTQEKTPKKMDYFYGLAGDIHGQRVKEINEGRKNGRKAIATFCVFVPEEIILAADGYAIGLCAGSQFWVPDGETVLPRNTCPLIKAFMGAKVGRTCPYFESTDLVVGETTCDGKKKAWELLGERMPVYVMELPQMKKDGDIDEWKSEIERFKDKVEEVTGNKITTEKLLESMKIIRNKKDALKRFYNLRKHNPAPVSGRDALLVTQLSFFDDPVRFTEKLNELCDELDDRVKNDISPFKKDTKRILLSGTPQALPNWKLHDIIEKSGASIVCEETCTGTRYFDRGEQPKDGSSMDQLMDSIAHDGMDVNCACFTPNDKRTDDIIRLFKEYNADGVIYEDLTFCTNYSIEYARVEKALKEAGIPLLHLETDYSDEDSGQLQTRVEAFLEML